MDKIRIPVKHILEILNSEEETTKIETSSGWTLIAKRHIIQSTGTEVIDFEYDIMRKPD